MTKTRTARSNYPLTDIRVIEWLARIARVFEKGYHLLDRRRLALYCDVAAGIFRPHLSHWEADMKWDWARSRWPTED